MLASLLLPLLPQADVELVPATEVPDPIGLRRSVAPLRPLSLKVMTPDARPVVGAEVRLLDVHQGPDALSLRASSARSIPEWVAGATAAIEPTTLTDANGRAHLADLSPASWLTVSSPAGHRLVAVTTFARATTSTMVLEPRVELLVTVRDRSRIPIADLPLVLTGGGNERSSAMTNV